jgi:hypothetical protein
LRRIGGIALSQVGSRGTVAVVNGLAIDKCVLAGTDTQVLACSSVEEILAVPAVCHVMIASADEEVISFSAEQDILAVAAGQGVVASAANQAILGIAAVQGVVAAQAEDQRAAVGGVERVVARRPQQDFRIVRPCAFSRNRLGEVRTGRGEHLEGPTVNDQVCRRPRHRGSDDQPDSGERPDEEALR